MAEISNNLIAGLLIVAILVSIVGLANTLTLIPVIQYTGFATTGTGKANVTIEGAISITLMRNGSIFGPGYVNLESTNTMVILATNKSNPEGDAGTSDGWFNNGSEGNTSTCFYGDGADTVCAQPFVVENDGNDPDTCIKIYAANTANAFIGGSTPDPPNFTFMGYNNESTWGTTEAAGTGYPASCTGTLTQAWTTVPLSGSPANVCTTLNSTQETDELRIHFRLDIPTDAPTGGKTNTVTIQASNPC